jgi:hypothetical protein
VGTDGGELSGPRFLKALIYKDGLGVPSPRLKTRRVGSVRPFRRKRKGCNPKRSLRIFAL